MINRCGRWLALPLFTPLPWLFLRGVLSQVPDFITGPHQIIWLRGAGKHPDLASPASRQFRCYLRCQSEGEGSRYLFSTKLGVHRIQLIQFESIETINPNWWLKVFKPSEFMNTDRDWFFVFILFSNWIDTLKIDSVLEIPSQIKMLKMYSERDFEISQSKIWDFL